MKKIIALACFVLTAFIANAQQDCQQGFEKRNVVCQGKLTIKCIPVDYSCVNCWWVDKKDKDSDDWIPLTASYNSYESASQKASAMHLGTYKIYMIDGDYCSNSSNTNKTVIESLRKKIGSFLIRFYEEVANFKRDANQTYMPGASFQEYESLIQTSKKEADDLEISNNNINDNNLAEIKKAFNDLEFKEQELFRLQKVVKNEAGENKAQKNNTKQPNNNSTPLKKQPYAPDVNGVYPEVKFPDEEKAISNQEQQQTQTYIDNAKNASDATTKAMYIQMAKINGMKPNGITPGQKQEIYDLEQNVTAPNLSQTQQVLNNLNNAVSQANNNNSQGGDSNNPINKTLMDTYARLNNISPDQMAAGQMLSNGLNNLIDNIGVNKASKALAILDKELMEVNNEYKTKFGFSILEFTNAIYLNDTVSILTALKNGYPVNAPVFDYDHGFVDGMYSTVTKCNDCKTIVDHKLYKYTFTGDDYYKQAIHYAAQLGNNELVKLFLRSGADINEKTPWYWYNKKPFFEKKFSDEYKMRTNELGFWTPLHYAVFYNKPETVKLLLSLGADKKIKAFSEALKSGKYYYTPIDIAKQLVFYDIEALLN